MKQQTEAQRRARMRNWGKVRLCGCLSTLQSMRAARVFTEQERQLVDILINDLLVLIENYTDNYYKYRDEIQNLIEAYQKDEMF